MCDCYQCNMTEEQQQAEFEKYIEWEYQQYKDKTVKPLDMNEWLKQVEVKEEN